MKVPWLSKKRIAARAEALLAGYEAATGRPAMPPVPVEEIIESYLGLQLCFEDLERKLGIPDVLGATYVGAGMISLNERLFEDASEGRLVFTAAHEVGHWVLHRRYASEQHRSVSQRPVIVCRLQSAKAPIEWQADYFAACLLMPEHHLRRAFARLCGKNPLVLANSRSSIGPAVQWAEPCAEHWPVIAACLCEAGGFSNVSKQAMIIRLQELGLLVNRSSAPLSWQTLRSSAVRAESGL